jgi:RNA polymerase sigma factor (sigma-70 family)
MEQPRFRLLDEHGDFLSPRIERVLIGLIPRFLRNFPRFADEVLLVESLEKAGRKIVRRETRLGPVENVHGYAWVVLRSIGVSWSRRGSHRLAGTTLNPDHSASALESIHATSGTAEQTENHIYFEEVMARLTVEEQLVCRRKTIGFTSQEIAEQRGMSAGAVDVLFWRVREKLRKLFLEHESGKPNEPDRDDPPAMTAVAERRDATDETP